MTIAKADALGTSAEIVALARTAARRLFKEGRLRLGDGCYLSQALRSDTGNAGLGHGAAS